MPLASPRPRLPVLQVTCDAACPAPAFGELLNQYKHAMRADTSMRLRETGRSANLRLRGGVPLMMASPKIIIAGAPASGKGTQCEFIVEKFGVVHISTGDALRAAVKAGTDVGKMAKEYMDKGGLVPDDVMIGIVKSRLAEDDCKEKGWLLDGFPRTGVQAKAMEDAGIKADKFVLLNVPDDVLVERCVGRRSDPETGKIYHLKFNPPPSDPEVQARLVHRSDDTEEAMVKRIEQYKTNVGAIKGFYKDITQEFDGVGDKMKLASAVADFIAKVRFRSCCCSSQTMPALAHG